MHVRICNKYSNLNNCKITQGSTFTFFQFVESAGQSGSSYSKDFKEGDPDPDSKTLLPDHIVAICISLALLAISVTSGITLFFLRKHVKFRSHQQNLS